MARQRDRARGRGSTQARQGSGDSAYPRIRIDASAYAIRLLPQGWRILRILLVRAPGIAELRDSDPSPRRSTRRGARHRGARQPCLASLPVAIQEEKAACRRLGGDEDAFDEQLALCKNGNFDFSVLMAQYLANLDFLSPTWLEENFDAIFAQQYPDNFSLRARRSALCAADQTGLSPPRRSWCSGCRVGHKAPRQPGRASHRRVLMSCRIVGGGRPCLSAFRQAV